MVALNYEIYWQAMQACKLLGDVPRCEALKAEMVEGGFERCYSMARWRGPGGAADTLEVVSGYDANRQGNMEESYLVDRLCRRAEVACGYRVRLDATPLLHEVRAEPV